MSRNILETRGLTVTFGGLNANDSVNLAVPEGSFVGLIGYVQLKCVGGQP